ncbi:MAG: hypothetical protein VX265_17700 [Myxococcota bacterium]|nr:hypothetical protein [Myxococcota bacterium]
MADGRATRWSRFLMGAGRRAWGVLPPVARAGLEQRFFYAVFNVTRVTNDDYGWRPPERSPTGPDGAPDDPSVR